MSRPAVEAVGEMLYVRDTQTGRDLIEAEPDAAEAAIWEWYHGAEPEDVEVTPLANREARVRRLLSEIEASEDA